MKKVIALIASIFIIALSIIPIVGAETYSLLPDEDNQIMYQIYPASHYVEPIYYDIVGYVTSSSATNPYAIPFFRTYQPNFSESHGTYSYDLYDGQSYFLFDIYAGSTYSVSIVTANLITGAIQTYPLITSTSVEYDYYMYVGADGYIYLQKYEYDTKNLIGSSTKLSVPLYGDIYIYNDIPDSNASYTDGYLEGKKDGLSQGESIGYEKGKKDQQAIYDATIDSVKNEEYNRGKAEGYFEGRQDAAQNTTDSEYWYNAGYLAGQNTNGIVEEGITGFFDSMVGFTEPFLNIGIGSLRVYTVLALLIIGGLALIFIKLTRG